MKKWFLPIALILVMGLSFSVEAKKKAKTVKADAEVSETAEAEEVAEEKVEKKVKKKAKKKAKKKPKKKAKKKVEKKTENITPDGSVTVEDADEEEAGLTAEDVIAEARVKPKKVKWEYLAVDLKPPEKDKYRRKWDALGRDGWELVGWRLKAGDTDVYIFKRPILDDD